MVLHLVVSINNENHNMIMWQFNRIMYFKL